MDIQRQIIIILAQNKRTIAVSESCSGGLLSNLFTNIPGSSEFFKLGIIPYDNKFKTSLLNIPKKIIKNKGAVSKETAILMAQNVRKLAKTSIGLGITGIAGPTGATKTKPVGLVYIALSFKTKIICKKFIFKGNRLSVKRRTAYATLNLLRENL